MLSYRVRGTQLITTRYKMVRRPWPVTGPRVNGWTTRMDGRFVTEFGSGIGDTSERRVHTRGVNSLRRVGGS